MKNNKVRQLTRNILLGAITIATILTSSTFPTFADDTASNTTGKGFSVQKVYSLTMPDGEKADDFQSPEETFTFKSGAYPQENATDSGTDGKASLAAISDTTWNNNTGEIQELDSMEERDKTAILSVTPNDINVSPIKFDMGAASTSGTGENIQVVVPSDFTKPGIYYYDFHEATGTTAGVDYDQNTYRIRVTVTRGTDGNSPTDIKLVNKTTGKKADNIANSYKAGELTFTKEVAGAIGDPDRTFLVNVTLTAPEGRNVTSIIHATGKNVVNESELTDITFGPDEKSITKTFTVKGGTSITLKNVPNGTVCFVKEADYSKAGYTTAYTYGGVTYDHIDENINTQRMNGAANLSVTITNTKNATIDTGIFTSNLPYILILLAAAAGSIVYVVSRRRHHA